MASSTVTGDRRWANARRGGMTVLGKVAVPKPINLPSQKLENHGLDPNVEIVPKGTLSWGSRPSSSGSNAWGTSALSPSADGSSSPGHLAGRPSSGGGSRPSTAGSDRAYDSNASAWGSNSRPSSASGVLASSNSTLTSLRPRSAETRPGSSQLSRFAESSVDASGPWGSNSSSERMGMGTSQNNGFSLSTGDFPTLGSEKDEPKKDAELQDDTPRNADSKDNSWRKDSPPYGEDGPRPGMERWHMEPHPYPNHNMGPPHYETWRGPPVNPHAVWYRGPPGPPPYGAPGVPGGFPMEPYPYYRTPAPGLAGSQPVPPGAGPHGHHPKNGDMYRPHGPDSYLRPAGPGMPIRPGFYPGPMPYEGYYGPPMGFCNPNDREMPFMGMAAGPHMYNRPVSQNLPDPNNSRPRSREGRGSDQVDPGHDPRAPPGHDPRAHYQVLTKPNDGWNQHEEERWGDRVPASNSNREKGILSRASVIGDNAWGDDYKEEEMNYRRSAPFKDPAPQSYGSKYGSANHPNVKFSMRNSDEVPPKDHSLIQKIEGLNAKTRSVGGRHDGFHNDESHEKEQMVTHPANVSRHDATKERHHPTVVSVPVSHDVVTAEKSREPAVSSETAAARRPVRGMHIRDDQGKGRFDGHDVDGWRKRSESDKNVIAAGSPFTAGGLVGEHDAAPRPAGAPKPNVDGSDPQRAKMREMASQRAEQLKKEEEERDRERMAKARAKLEELDRRSATQRTDTPSQKLDTLPHSPSPVSQKQEHSWNKPELSSDASQRAVSSAANPNKIIQTVEKSTSKTVESSVSSAHQGAEIKRSTYKDSVLSQNQLPAVNVKHSDASDNRAAPQVHEPFKQKRQGYKQRQNVPMEKNDAEISSPAGRTDFLKDHKDISPSEEVSSCDVSGAGKVPAEAPLIPDPPVHQKKKNNKSGRNKQKGDESSKVMSTSSNQSNASGPQATPVRSEQSAPEVNNKYTSFQSSAEDKEVGHSSENDSLSREDGHGRQNQSWKSQNSRKPRNHHGNRTEKLHSNEAAVWAPVRSQNKAEVVAQTSQKVDESSLPSAAGDNLGHSSSKTRRAEMERYVPKPVAKELAQQSSSQQSQSSSVDQAATDVTGGREKGPQAPESKLVESKQLDGKQKQQKAHGSWRQRVTPETVPVQPSQDSSSSANTSKNCQTSNRSQQSVKSEESLVGGLPLRSDDHRAKTAQANISDGWNSPDDSNSGVKDQAQSGKVRRQPFKGHKVGKNNQNVDLEDSRAGYNDSGRPGESSQAEKTLSSKENRATGDRSASHWQPKSQGHVPFNHQGSRGRGPQNFASEDSRAFREAGHKGNRHHTAQHDQIAPRVSVPVSDGKDGSGGLPNVGPQETKQDKISGSVRRRPLPNEVSKDEVESVPLGPIDGRNEQRPSSGHYRNGNNGGRYNRGNESRGNWSSTVDENKHHYSSGNRERSRQNSHYAYQPVGSYNMSRPNESGAQPESQHGSPRFRERGNNQGRRGRGNFNGRRSGNGVEAGYD